MQVKDKKEEKLSGSSDKRVLFHFIVAFSSSLSSLPLTSPSHPSLLLALALFSWLSLFDIPCFVAELGCKRLFNLKVSFNFFALLSFFSSWSSHCVYTHSHTHFQHPVVIALSQKRTTPCLLLLHRLLRQALGASALYLSCFSIRISFCSLPKYETRVVSETYFQLVPTLISASKGSSAQQYLLVILFLIHRSAASLFKPSSS